MTQYATIRLRMPSDMNVAELEKQLIKKGFKVKIDGVFIQMKGFPNLEQYKDLEGG